MSAGIKLILKIFLVDVTLRLSFAHESNNFEHQAIVNLTRCKFDGVEVNNHVAIFGSELHLGEIPLTLIEYTILTTTQPVVCHLVNWFFLYINLR